MRRPRTRWEDYIEDLGWNRMELHSSEMLAVAANHDVRQLNLELLTRQPSRTRTGAERRRCHIVYKSLELIIIQLLRRSILKK